MGQLPHACAHRYDGTSKSDAVVQSLNASVDTYVAKESIPGADIARYVPSVDRARRLLGLKQTVDLKEAIRRTAAWYVAEGTEGV